MAEVSWAPEMAPVLATWITPQVVFNGIVFGLVTALVALGVVLIFRATKVINFAVGNMGLPAAFLLVLLTTNYGVGFWLALTISVAVGAAFAAAAELIVVRRLFRAPRVILLVATIGIAGLAQAIVFALPDVERDVGGRYPVPIDAIWEDIAGVRITGPQLTILVVVPAIAGGLAWLLNHTAFGRKVQASADNPDLARLSGISPKKVSTFVWIVGGVLASVSLIMLSGLSGSPIGLEDLGANTLNRALAAAVLAGMVSFPRALLAGVALGVAEALLDFNFLDQAGMFDMLLFLAVAVAVYLQTRQSRNESATFSFAPRIRPIPQHLRAFWWIRHLGTIVGAVALVFAALLPIVVTQPSRHLLYTTVVGFAVAAVSLVVVTGWSGQLSLGQMAFAGIGALSAAAANRGFELDIGFGDTRILDFQLRGVSWALSLLIGMSFAAVTAVLVGLGALRVRGLMLAVTTFSFGLAAQQFLFQRPFFSDERSSSVRFDRGSVLGLDLSSERSYYWFCLAALAVVIVAIGRLRRTGVGRSTIAVRDNPDNAAAYTVLGRRTQLTAFALAGGLAGLGGILLAGALQSVPLTDRIFQVDDSLQLVAMVVIGGLGSVAGAVIGALWVVGIPALFPDNDVVPLLTSSMGLLVLLLYFPGGLVQIGYSARDALVDWVDKRRGTPVPARSIATSPRARPARPERTVTDPVLGVRDLSVHFGGNVAVDSASIEVHPGEVVGLIGTNGAGKSTLLNAIGGYVPSAGEVELIGTRVSHMSPAGRAELGLGRTFQAATLFPELTVRETLMVALEARGRTHFAATTLALPASRRQERQRRSDTEELIDFLGLGRYSDSYTADLSTGTRRIVELASLLAVDAQVLCLDEPTAGVAQRESEAFGPLILMVREELDAAMVVIEHDMPLIMGISDRVYCLNLGQVIAEGPPEDVRDDPLVIASYLGTDQRAIDRSDSVGSAGGTARSRR